MKRLSLSYLALGLFLSCVEQTELPTEINIPSSFGAGDTTYLLQRPIWDSSWGFQTPSDLSIALDGRIFVADSAANRIFVLSQDGVILDGFDALSDLVDDAGNPLSPIDVDIDTKMNVYYTDGGNKVYRWNQYYNDRGIDAVSIGATFRNTSSGDTTILAITDPLWLQTANDPNWDIYDIQWSTDSLLIAQFTQPSVFYDASSPINQQLDPFYDGDKSRFTALTSTVGSERYIYATDAFDEVDKDRIIQILLARTYYIKLSSDEYPAYDGAATYQDGSAVNYVFNGITFTFRWIADDPGSGHAPMNPDGTIAHDYWELDDALWSHFGIFGATVVDWGTGVGSVISPTGIDVDYAGRVYYSQNSEYFSANSVMLQADGNFVSIFDAASDDIMEISRFSNPQDIAVDSDQNIYVANTGDQVVEVFRSNGSFYKTAGEDFLEGPVAVTVDDRGLVYICDLPSSSIIRYKLSNELDENALPEN